MIRRQLALFLALAPLISADEALNIDSNGIVKQSHKETARSSLVRRHDGKSAEPPPPSPEEGANTTKHCHVPKVENASCLEGEFIEHGQKCHPECARIWSGIGTVDEKSVPMKPDVKSMNCTDGVLSPATFTCHEVHKCKAPQGIENAGTPACEEGDEVDSDNICSPQCKTGFKAYVPQNRGQNILLCADGEIAPKIFQCMTPSEADAAIAADLADAAAHPAPHDLAAGSGLTEPDGTKEDLLAKPSI